MLQNAVSAYELLRQYDTVIEKEGKGIVDIERAYGGLPSSAPLKTWFARRRADGEIYLAREFDDKNKEILGDGDVRFTLLNLLRHPNLVSLHDIVYTNGTDTGYTVWDNCDKGTLNSLMYHCRHNSGMVQLPESLCWHVVVGIGRALLWLHEGYKFTYPVRQSLKHDKDWWPIVVRDIIPTKVFFCSPKGSETYGLVKLGGLEQASTLQTFDMESLDMESLKDFPTLHTEDIPPDVRPGFTNIKPIPQWSPADDVFMLGTLIYRMMVGHNPEIDMEAALENETAVPKAYATPLPESYSRSLQALVYNLLQTDRENRYTAAEVVKYGDAGFKTYETRMKVFDRYSFRTTADRDDRPDLSL